MDNREHSALLVHNRLSPIWLVPIIALAVTGWLGWRSLSDRGQVVTISFENADGLEAGRTKIRHKNAELGTVEKVMVTSDLSHVIVTARMKNVTAPFLTEGAQFWMVRPEFSAEGISSLEPLISGSYIEFQPGKGKSKNDFIGEEAPHLLEPDGPGEIFTLHTAQLSGISQGTPVYFHGTKVGQVLGYELSDTDGNGTVHVFVHAPHDKLVHTGTRFWNSSGITVQAGSTGLKLQLQSLQTLLTGGISFDVPPHAEPGAAADAKTNFELYADLAAAEDSAYTNKLRFSLHFTEPVAGLAPGAQVRLQGLAVGQVVSVHIHYDVQTNHFVVPVIIEVEADRLDFIHEGKPSQDQMHADFRTFIAHGLRARLGTGNLLTGQKIVDLTLEPDAQPVDVAQGGEYPEIPTLSAQDMDSAVRTANDVLTNLKSTTAALNKIATSPDLMQSVHSLSKSLDDLDKAFGTAEGGGDLAGALREIKEAARSFRVLTDYLEAHPEAILRGKPAENDK